jgi:predicted lipoprotein with Yx(FWY)xxD motif
MIRSRANAVLAPSAVIALVALAAAGCGGGNDDSGSSPPLKKTSGSTETVDVAHNGNLGDILVDSQGRTLYLFQKDSGTTSACFGECAQNWPPLRAAGKPTVGKGADAAKLGTTKRSDGKPEVTYNGHPLYLFANDKQAGDANGQGIQAFGGGWYALSPSGDQVSGSGGGGNGY